MNKEYHQINYEPYRNKICKVFIFGIVIFAIANEKLKVNIIRDHTFVLGSCATKYGMQLENGDLLLVSANGSTLSGAIDRVTQTGKATHYSHIGMLEKKIKIIGFCMPAPGTDPREFL